MIDSIHYNSETRTFDASLALGLANLGVGIAGTAANTVATFRSPSYDVVYLASPGKPAHKRVRAESSLDAIAKAKRSGAIGSKFRAFMSPTQDDQAQNYVEKLKSEK